MGWFSSIAETVTDFFTDSDNVSSLVSSAAEIGTDLYTSNQTAKANTKAAATVAQGYEAQANAIKEGNEAAQRRYEEVEAQTKPGLTYLREVTNADPYQLTQGQNQQLDRLREGSINSLNQSGLRGSGRAVTEAVRKIESDYTGDAINSNIAQSQNAATQLASYNTNASINAANADLSTGARVGSLGVGANEAKANADLSNTSLSGEALGSIQSLIRDEEKEGRKSQYGWGEEEEKT